MVKIIKKSIIIFIFSLKSTYAVSSEKDFYTHRADVAGALYGAVLLAIKYKSSECPITIHKDWLNKSLVKKNILSSFPPKLINEITLALNESEAIADNEWESIKKAIRNKRQQGYSCDEIQNKAFWPLFNDAVTAWKKEVNQ